MGMDHGTTAISFEIIDENKEEIDSSIEYVLAVLNAYNNSSKIL